MLDVESASAEQQRLLDEPEPDEPEHEKFCRICHDSTDNGEDGRLFRPCSCRGSMAWVHVECLDKWRRASTNPQSFYRCDQCHFEYKFAQAFTAYGHGFGDRFTVAKVLGSRFAVHVASVAVLLTLIFVAGFLAKALGFCGGLGWGEVWSFANREHFFAGSALVGLSSLAGALIEFCSTFYRIGRIGGIYSPFPDLGGRGGGGGGGGGDAQKIILVIVVVIGLLVALHWIYKHLQILAEAAARRTQDIVLDYDHHRPREEEQQGEAVADMETAEYGTPARER